MRSAQYRVVQKLKDRYSVVAMCAYFGFPRSSYYLLLKNGKPDYKAFDWNLAEHITASFKEQPKGYRYHWRQLQRQKISIIIRNHSSLYENLRAQIPYSQEKI